VIVVSDPSNMPIGSGKNLVLGWQADAVHNTGPLGTVTITFSNDSPRNVGISGGALLGGVGTNPASVEFGAVCAGSTASKDIEVYADEAGDIMLGGFDKPVAPFDATTMAMLPRSLGGNHSGPSVIMAATFKPMMAGEFDGVLALTTDIPGMTKNDIKLQGIALPGGIAATPDAVHFGVATVGDTTSLKEVQFTNCGSGDLSFTGASVTGVNANQFALISVNPPRVLKPTESEKFTVVMQPKSSGLKSARLAIAHDQGTTFADLDGTGEGINKERETYYACSTGRSAGLWPLLIALLALRRRRR
jgi:hypothetical protein